MIRSVLRSSTESLLHLFYPRRCLYCDHSLSRDEKTLCLHCIFRLPRTGFHNNPDNKTAGIFIGRVPIEHATSFVLFTKDGMMQDLLHTLKYKGKKEIGTLLGALFAAELRYADWIKDIDCIIALPLHKKREGKEDTTRQPFLPKGLPMRSVSRY